MWITRYFFSPLSQSLIRYFVSNISFFSNLIPSGISQKIQKAYHMIKTSSCGSQQIKIERPKKKITKHKKIQKQTFTLKMLLNLSKFA